MTFFRQAGGQILLFILSLVGIGVSVYLISVHYQGTPLVCSTSGFVDCERVLASTFASVPGTTIPISVPGLLWFVVSAVLALVAWRTWPAQRMLYIVEFVWTVLGMGTVIYLLYVEIVRLHTLCAWCTVLHAIILVMFLATGIQLFEPKGEADLDEEEEHSTVSVARKP